MWLGVWLGEWVCRRGREGEGGSLLFLLFGPFALLAMLFSYLSITE